MIIDVEGRKRSCDTIIRIFIHLLVCLVSSVEFGL